MISVIKTSIATVALCLAFPAAPTPAQAFDDAETMSVVVPTRDIDLSTEAGVDTLNARINRAATKVCGGHPAPTDLWQLREYNECKGGAVARAQSSRAYALAVGGATGALAEGPAARASMPTSPPPEN